MYQMRVLSVYNFYKCGCHYRNYSEVNSVVQCSSLMIELYAYNTRELNLAAAHTGPCSPVELAIETWLQKTAHVSAMTNSELTLSWVLIVAFSWSSASHFGCLMWSWWLFTAEMWRKCSIVSQWDCVWHFLVVYWCQTRRENWDRIIF